MAKAVLPKMGIEEVDGVLTEFGSLIPGLKAGRFDIIAAGMFVNPQALRAGRLLRALLRHRPGLPGAGRQPQGHRRLLELRRERDLKLAVMAGAVEAGYANDAGVALDQLVSLPDQSSLVARAGRPRRRRRAHRALDRRHGLEERGRRVDQALRRGRRQVGQGPRRLRLPQGGHRPLEAFNAELTEFIGTPEHIALVEPFGFGEDYLPNKTTAELCAGE